MKSIQNANEPNGDARARSITILALGGTTRRGSTSEKALAIAVQEARRLGADVIEFTGPDLAFPIFDPERTDAHEGVENLRAALHRCDGVLISSAAYHGSVPGILKNAIDYIDASDPERPYLTDRAVGTIACAGGWQACGTTLAALRSIVHALRAWPTPLGITINSSEPVFAADGSCMDTDLASKLRSLAAQVVHFAAAQKFNPAGQPATDREATPASHQLLPLTTAGAATSALA